MGKIVPLNNLKSVVPLGTADWYRAHAAREDMRAVTARQIDAFSSANRAPAKAGAQGSRSPRWWS